MERLDVVVAGAGFAGLSAALWARRLGLQVAVLERLGQEGGQLLGIALPIADYPGLEAVDGRELAARLRDQVRAAGAVLRTGEPILRIDAARRLCTTPAGSLQAGALVIATGISPRRLGIPGEAEWLSSGLVHRPSEELDWFRGRRVAVVGGGDRAAENALLLAGAAERVFLLHRGESMRARAAFQERLAGQERVELRPCTTLAAIHLRGDGVQLEGTQHGAPFTRAADALCIYIGNQPNTDLLAGQVAMTPEGYLSVDGNGQTSAPGVYGVGDVCTAPQYQSLATAAGQAMVAAKHIALSRP